VGALMMKMLVMMAVTHLISQFDFLKLPEAS
jgi:hypothetical protein